MCVYVCASYTSMYTYVQSRYLCVSRGVRVYGWLGVDRWVCMCVCVYVCVCVCVCMCVNVCMRMPTLHPYVCMCGCAEYANVHVSFRGRVCV